MALSVFSQRPFDKSKDSSHSGHLKFSRPMIGMEIGCLIFDSCVSFANDPVLKIFCGNGPMH